MCTAQQVTGVHQEVLLEVGTKCSGCCGFPGAVALPFLVRKAKLTGSGPTVFRQSLLLNAPVFALFWKVSMFSAAHHCVAVQPMPGRPGRPARRVELHLHEALARAEAEVARAVLVRVRVHVRVAVRLARHGCVAGHAGPSGLGEPWLSHSCMPSQKVARCWKLSVPPLPSCSRQRRRILGKPDQVGDVVARARAVGEELDHGLVVTDVRGDVGSLGCGLGVARDLVPVGGRVAARDAVRPAPVLRSRRPSAWGSAPPCGPSGRRRLPGRSTRRRTVRRRGRQRLRTRRCAS